MSDHLLEHAMLVLASIGLAVVIVYPEDGEPPAAVRRWLVRQLDRRGLKAWAGAADCYVCCAFWAGAAMGLLGSVLALWPGHLLAGLCAAGVVWLAEAKAQKPCACGKARIAAAPRNHVAAANADGLDRKRYGHDPLDGPTSQRC